MVAPRSNFTVPQSYGWFVFATPTGYKTARMNGRTFISLLERTLRMAPQLASPVRTFDGTQVQGTDVREGDGQWGPTVNRAMWALASATGAPSAILTVIQAATRSRTITLSMMTTAAQMLLSSRYPGAVVRIPANGLLPTYMAILPGINVGSPEITDSTPDELAAVGVHNDGTINVPRPTPGAEPTGESTPTPGTDTGGGKPHTADDGSGPEKTLGPDEPRLPTGAPDTRITSRGISWGPIAAVGGGIALLALLAISLSSEPARENPPRLGPKFARMYVTRERLDRGGYTKRGRYFGIGAPLFHYYGEDIVDRNGTSHRYVDDWIRASDRADALRQLSAMYRNVRFAGAE